MNENVDTEELLKRDNDLKNAFNDLKELRNRLETSDDIVERNEIIRQLTQMTEDIENKLNDSNKLDNTVKEQLEELDNRIASLSEELESYKRQYDASYSNLEKLIDEQTEQLENASLLSDEKLEELNEAYANKKLEENENSIKMKKQIDDQLKLIDSLSRKRKNIVKDLENSSELGISFEDYRKLNSTLKSRNIMNAIYDAKGLSDITGKKAADRTKDEKKELKKAKEDALNEISSMMSKEEVSVLDAIEMLYSFGVQYSATSKTPRIMKLPSETIDNIKKNLNEIPEKVANDITERDYVAGNAPKDMIGRIVIRTDSETGYKYVNQATLDRFRDKFGFNYGDSGRIETEEGVFYRISDEDVSIIYDNKDNELDPYIIEEKDINNTNEITEEENVEENKEEDVKDTEEDEVVEENKDTNNLEDGLIKGRILIYNDLDTNNKYVRKTTVDRFGFDVDFDSPERIEDDGVFYRITDDDLFQIYDNKDNELDPYIIEEKDTHLNQNTMENNDTNDLSDGLIKGRILIYTDPKTGDKYVRGTTLDRFSDKFVTDDKTGVRIDDRGVFYRISDDDVSIIFDNKDNELDPYVVSEVDANEITPIDLENSLDSTESGSDIPEGTEGSETTDGSETPEDSEDSENPGDGEEDLDDDMENTDDNGLNAEENPALPEPDPTLELPEPDPTLALPEPTNENENTDDNGLDSEENPALPEPDPTLELPEPDPTLALPEPTNENENTDDNGLDSEENPALPEPDPTLELPDPGPTLALPEPTNENENTDDNDGPDRNSGLDDDGPGNDGPGNDGPDGPGNDGPDGPGNDGPDGPGNDGPDGPGNDGPDGPGNDGPDGPGNDGPDGPGNDGPDGPGNDGPDGPGNDGPDGPGNDGPDGPGNDGPEGPGDTRQVRPPKDVEKILAELTRGLHIGRKDAKKYNASNIQVARTFRDELHSGNYQYNIVHFAPAVGKAIVGFLNKIAAKLTLTPSAEQVMRELEERLNNLPEEELQTLFDEYKGNKLKEDMNVQINPLILARLRRFGLERVENLNNRIRDNYARLFPLLSEIDALEVSLASEEITDEERANIETQRTDLINQAAAAIKEIDSDRKDANNLLSSGVHGLEEDFKAVSTKLSYVGKRFGRIEDFDNELQERLGEYGQGLKDAIFYDNAEDIVRNFVDLEATYSENTEIANSIFGRRSVGKKYYSPLAEQFDYRDDPFVRDLFTTIAMTSAAVSAVNAVRVHAIESQRILQEHQVDVATVNQANDSTLAYVDQTAQAISAKRQTFQEGMDAQMYQDIITTANSLERKALDKHGWGNFDSAYHLDDSAHHLMYNQYYDTVHQQVQNVASNYASGAIDQAQALQDIANAANTSQSTLNQVMSDCLTVLRPYAQSHPQFDLHALEEAMDYISQHPDAINEMNQGMVDATNLSDTLVGLSAQHVTALSSLPSDMLTTLIASASACGLALNVASKMGERYNRNNGYGNEITDNMGELARMRAEREQEQQENENENENENEDEDENEDEHDRGGRGR